LVVDEFERGRIRGEYWAGSRDDECANGEDSCRCNTGETGR
jgi:hypothetical protein